MGKDRAFSLYDIEQFLRDAGAERINEKAVLSLEEELENTVKEVASEAQVYANYAGRSLIKDSDVKLVGGKAGRRAGHMVISKSKAKRRIVIKGGKAKSSLNVRRAMARL